MMNVEIIPILSAMRRNKVGAILIAVQMAITLAILCNALFIIQQRLAWSERPTGLDEENVFVVTNQWVGAPSDLKARLQGDMQALRSVPGVVDATVTESYPLSGGGSTDSVKLDPDQKGSAARTAVYYGDEHALSAMGLRLVAGRDFTADEVRDKASFSDLVPPAAVIVTQGLADKLFPKGDALGKSIFIEPRRSRVAIVGIVARLQVPWVTFGKWGAAFNDNSIVVPYHWAITYSHYIVRAQPGQIGSVMHAVEKKLYDVNRMRVLERIQPQSVARAEAYQDDRGLVVILAVVCIALLLVTAFGIVGLTSYWVAQRRKQIGIRRALGATRTAIMRYFQTENLLIAAAGSGAGILLAVALNLWMVNAFAMERLNVAYAFIGAIAILVLGQAATLWPALRAASVSPALATRSGQ